MAPFVYTPLQPGEIRLLCPDIQPDGDVSWLLKVVRFQDQLGNPTTLDYDALSYTWGDSSQKPSFTITCNDQEFQVHQNLNSALPFLARRDSQLPIWIDAICIDQNNDAEKVRQIRMMKGIFEEATQVWVWLGPGNGQSAEVIAKLPGLFEEGMEIYSLLSQQWFANRPKVMSWLSSDDTWSTFYDLVNNRWYSRLWVFQEAAFAKELRVLLGSHEVEWNVLERVIQSAPNWDFVGADGKRPERLALRTGIIFDTRKIIQRLVALGKPVTGDDAATILQCTQDADCLEPRDRVFAMLGFFAFQVEENASLEDMYSQLTLFMLSILPATSRPWWMLLRSARSANKRQGLPSWCPDFHDVEGQDYWSLKCQDHSASRREGTYDVTYDPQSKRLFLEGQIIDTIRTVLPEFPDTSGMMKTDQIIAFHSWQSSLETIIFADQPSRQGQARIYSDRNEVAEALWNTLKAGVAYAELPYETLTQFKEDRCVILQNLETIDRYLFSFPISLPSTHLSQNVCPRLR